MMLDLANLLVKTPDSPSCPLLGNGFCVYGSRQCGKTSFGFQAAVNTVLEGGNVVVICSENQIFNKQPCPFTPLSSLSEQVLNNIEFIYADDWEKALRELLLMKSMADVPSLILIDDGGWTAVREKKTVQDRVALALSVLHNISDWMTRNGRPFYYVVVTNAVAADDTSARGSTMSSREANAAIERPALPLGAFPTVFLHMDACGTVCVFPVPTDTVRVDPIRTTWGEGGLQMISS